MGLLDTKYEGVRGRDCGGGAGGEGRPGAGGGGFQASGQPLLLSLKVVSLGLCCSLLVLGCVGGCSEIPVGAGAGVGQGWQAEQGRRSLVEPHS